MTLNTQLLPTKAPNSPLNNYCKSQIDYFCQNMKDKNTTSFPFYLNNNLGNTLLCFGISLFSVLFLSVFNPFPNLNSQNTFNDILIIGFSLFLVLLFNLILLPRIFPNLFDVTYWTVKKFIFFNIWLLLFVGISLSVVSYVFIGNCQSFMQSLSSTLLQVATIGIFPLFFITFHIRNRMLAENLKSATIANESIQEITHQILEENPNLEVCIKTDTTETLSVMRHDIIFAEAQDNYSMIHYISENKQQKKLLRLTLKNLESQLANKILIRCHKSFLINIMSISSISGNSNGYKLHIKDTDIQVPVSRSKGKEIITQIELIKDTLAIL